MTSWLVMSVPSAIRTRGSRKISPIARARSASGDTDTRAWSCRAISSGSGRSSASITSDARA